ncbi:hypothetical protein Tdes44962_MAKER06527 [Teratosphaeria destructans]|uniref:Uncharacterized protein n=1 Tax=Teratosphaeria destructans TaxID=418781 RepID=A0A9W7T142_9PEZI|nr:hypothetical protein Tdes44962_MAKER06527 [Teratosphaeria destructans]
MTANAFKLGPTEVDQAVNGMPYELRVKQYGNFTAEQYMRGNHKWSPDAAQSRSFAACRRDLDVGQYPSDTILGALLKQMHLYSGNRAFDRRMAVKVLRLLEKEWPPGKKRASKVEVENMINRALDVNDIATPQPPSSSKSKGRPPLPSTSTTPTPPPAPTSSGKGKQPVLSPPQPPPKEPELPTRRQSVVTSIETVPAEASTRKTKGPVRMAPTQSTTPGRTSTAVPSVEPTSLQEPSAETYASALNEIRRLAKLNARDVDVNAMSEDQLVGMVKKHIKELENWQIGNEQKLEGTRQKLEELSMGQ